MGLRELKIFDGSNSMLQMLGVRAVKYDIVDVAGCELHKWVITSWCVWCTVSVADAQSTLCTPHSRQLCHRLFTHVCHLRLVYLCKVPLPRLTPVSNIFSERELKFMFAICHRRSVCRLSVVCNVGAPYSGEWNFRQYFCAMWYLGHPWTSYKNFTDIVPGEPLRQGS